MSSVVELDNLSDALEFLREKGFHAFTRKWALGETIGVAAEPFEHGAIRGWGRMVYIAPAEDGWSVHDLRMPGEPPAPSRSLQQACSMAISALQAGKVERTT